MPTVFLTGGAGMLGRCLQDAFRELRPDVKVLAPSRTELDLLDRAAVVGYLERRKPDLVIHAAAKVGGIQANIDDPAGFLTENSQLNLNVIQGAASSGVRDLIYIGSSCMYPRDYDVPLKEAHLLEAPLEPTNEGYAIAKILGAKLCEYNNRSLRTNFKTLIPSNLYGRYDHFDPIKSHLVPALLLKLHNAKQKGEREVTVWGDGSARREFLYADDLARYIVQLDTLSLQALPDYLNLGYGSDFTVREYYEFGCEVVGYGGKLVFDTSKPAGMKRKLLDSTRAAALGWKASTTPQAGMAREYEFFVKQQQGASR